jgi:HEPN domain-containing protein
VTGVQTCALPIYRKFFPRAKVKENSKEQFTKKGGFYMNNEEVQEWLEVADRDLDSALLLNVAVRRHFEIICYLCAQAAEKYLKCYLVFNDILPKKTHDLRHLNLDCSEIDNDFQNVYDECVFLNRFATDIRYPNKNEITEGEVVRAIAAVEKIRDFKPILDTRTVVSI